MKPGSTLLAFTALALAAFSLPEAMAQDDITGQLEQSNRVSPEEMLRFADMALDEIKMAVDDVSSMLEDAEREQDAALTQNLGTALATLRALYEVSQSSALKMEQAIDDGDLDLAEHEYRKLTIALAKARQYRNEAEGYVGETEAEPGQTSVEVIEEPLEYFEEDTAIFDIYEDTFDDTAPTTSPFQ